MKTKTAYSVEIVRKHSHLWYCGTGLLSRMDAAPTATKHHKVNPNMEDSMYAIAVQHRTLLAALRYVARYHSVTGPKFGCAEQVCLASAADSGCG